MHHWVNNERRGENAWWQLYKNTWYCFKQILEAAPNKSAAVWPLVSHLENNPSKTARTYTSALCRQWMQSRRLAWRQIINRDGWCESLSVEAEAFFMVHLIVSAGIFRGERSWLMVRRQTSRSLARFDLRWWSEW